MSRPWDDLRIQQFLTKAHEHFDEIARQHGMSCSSEEVGYWLRYQNKLMAMSISYDAMRSHEVNVGFRELAAPPGSSSLPMDLGLVMRWKNHPEADSVFERASDLLTLSAALERLANMTKDQASGILDGVHDELTSLREFQVKDIAEYNLQMWGRKQLEKAWIERNYAAYVVTGNRFKPFLSPDELDRLETAERMIAEHKTA
jgi:hypothetical protein